MCGPRSRRRQSPVSIQTPSGFRDSYATQAKQQQTKRTSHGKRRAHDDQSQGLRREPRVRARGARHRRRVQQSTCSACLRCVACLLSWLVALLFAARQSIEWTCTHTHQQRLTVTAPAIHACVVWPYRSRLAQARLCVPPLRRHPRCRGASSSCFPVSLALCLCMPPACQCPHASR